MDTSSSQGHKGSSGENRPSDGSVRNRKRTRKRTRKTGEFSETEGQGQPRRDTRPTERKPGFFRRLLRFFGLGREAGPEPVAKPGAGVGASPARKRRESVTADVTSGRLYVGNLAYDIGEADLKNRFETVGTVVSAEIVTNPETSRSKGFAFVEMGSVEEARRAVEELNDTDFMGRSMLVTGALSEGRKRGDAEKIQESPRGRADRDRGDGRRKSGQKREKRGESRSYVEENESPAPKRRAQARVTSPRLWVGNLDSEVTDDLVREAFDGFGTIVALELSGTSARIEMSSIDEAQRVVEVLDDKMFMGRRLKITGAREEPPAVSAAEASPAVDGPSSE